MYGGGGSVMTDTFTITDSITTFRKAISDSVEFRCATLKGPLNLRN